MFAKLFGPPKDQILAMIRSGEDCMEIRVFVKPGSPFDVCETALEFKEGREKEARKFFEEMTEEQAREIAASLYEAAGKFNNELDSNSAD